MEQRPSMYPHEAHEKILNEKGVELSSNEEEVRRFFNSFAEVQRRGKIREIMALFAPELVAFDMMPPLHFLGKEEYRKTNEAYYTDMFEFPVKSEWRDLKIDVAGDLAVGHGLYHVSGAFKGSGELVECWLRSTLCLTKRAGQWLITHIHNSVPVADDGMALMNLRPDEKSIH